MNKATRWGRTIGFVAGSALVVLLAGCATYVEAPPPPPPPPPVAYVPPPPPPPGSPGPMVVVQSDADFDEPLSPYGHWEVVGDYGRCWVPDGVGADWQPYGNGYWEYTDAGWYWVSDEPWAWATYHYGRWVYADSGWAWAPQTQWAPAWVVWREGGGYCGWAPMSVTARFGAGGFVDVNVGAYGPRAFVFVDERHFMDPVRPGATVIVNQTIINKTVNITRVQVVNKTVINGGPHPDVIARATGRSIQPVPVRQLRHQQEATFVKKQPALQKLRPVHKPKPAPTGQAPQREATEQDNAGRQENGDKQQFGQEPGEEKAQENREKKPAAKKKKKKKKTQQQPGRQSEEGESQREGEGEGER